MLVGKQGTLSIDHEGEREALVSRSTVGEFACFSISRLDTFPTLSPGCSCNFNCLYCGYSGYCGRRCIRCLHGFRTLVEEIWSHCFSRVLSIIGSNDLGRSNFYEESLDRWHVLHGVKFLFRRGGGRFSFWHTIARPFFFWPLSLSWEMASSSGLS